MKTILCFGDSNTHGTAPMHDLSDSLRFGPAERWPGVLRQQLGADYWVIEEGLPGRTTVWPDPIEGEYKSGKAVLPAILESHRPLDLVIVMLGTNDLKKRFSVSALDISLSVGVLVDIIQKSGCGPNDGAPQVLLMCPPPLAKLTWLAEMFEGGEEKSRLMARHYFEIAHSTNCAFFNAGEVIQSAALDGIHFDLAAHHTLGVAVAGRVQEILK